MSEAKHGSISQEAYAEWSEYQSKNRPSKEDSRAPAPPAHAPSVRRDYANPTAEIAPGDIVFDTAKGEDRVVMDVRPDLGLVAFEDSGLVGWTSVQGLAPTGRCVERK